MAKQTKGVKANSSELPKYKSNNESQSESAAIKSSWQLSGQAVKLLVKNWKIFSWLLLVYGALELVLVQNLANVNITSVKSAIGLGNSGNTVGDSFQFFAAIFSNGNLGLTGNAWNFMIAVLMSLVVIWCLRWILSGKAAHYPNVSDAFYKSSTPLVPFLLIVILMAVQLVPMVLGSVLYALVTQNSITASGFELAFFFLIMVGLAALSIYWLTRTIVSLYIVTLPDMKPLAAYAEAKNLVDGRRLSVARKIIFLPAALFVISAVLIVPVIMIYAPLAQWWFFLLSLLGLFLAHAYLYLMYRSLLGDESS